MPGINKRVFPCTRLRYSLVAEGGLAVCIRKICFRWAKLHSVHTIRGTPEVGTEEEIKGLSHF